MVSYDESGKIIQENGIEYYSARDIIDGIEDSRNAYWNSFLPIFFDRMNTMMRRTMAKVLENTGLSSSHAYYMIALNLEGPQTLVQLSKFLDMDLSTSNRIYKTLKEKGMIADDRISPSSKKFCIFLTPKGKEIADRVMIETQNTVNGYFEGVDQNHISIVRSVLVKVLERSDPDFNKYVDSTYTNPFYTYLGTHPEKENIALPKLPQNKS